MPTTRRSRYPDYRSTVKRVPTHDMVRIVQTLSETTGPGPAWAEFSEEDADLTTNAGTGSPAIGERIIVTGRVLDENGAACPTRVLEIWQPNASGRYAHWRETDFPAPLDPNFLGVGQCLTDRRRRVPVHHHQAGPLSVGQPSQRLAALAHPLLAAWGRPSGCRLVTQMYFEGDPLLPLDPIFNSVPDHSRAPDDRHLRPRRDRGELGARISLGHRAAGRAGDTAGRVDD